MTHEFHAMLVLLLSASLPAVECLWERDYTTSQFSVNGGIMNYRERSKSGDVISNITALKHRHDPLHSFGIYDESKEGSGRTFIDVYSNFLGIGSQEGNLELFSPSATGTIFFLCPPLETVGFAGKKADHVIVSELWRLQDLIGNNRQKWRISVQLPYDTESTILKNQTDQRPRDRGASVMADPTHQRETLAVVFAIVIRGLVDVARRKTFTINFLLTTLTILALFRTVECSTGVLGETSRKLADHIIARGNNDNNTEGVLMSLLLMLNQQNRFDVEILYDLEHAESSAELHTSGLAGIMLHRYDGSLTTVKMLIELANPHTFLVTFFSFANVLDIFRKVKNERLESHLVNWVLILSWEDFEEESLVALQDLIFEGTRVTLVQRERSRIYNIFEASVGVEGDMHFYFKGRWSHTPQLVMSQEKNKYWNMNGRTLTIAANNALPYLALGERKPDGTYEPYSGVDLSVLNSLSASMNFTYRVVRPPDGQWGYPQLDGSITGMIGMVARREVHMAITGIAINEKRASVVQFTTSYLDNYLVIVSRALKEKNRSLAVLSPFSQQVWICIIVATLAIGPIMKMRSKLSQIIGIEESSLGVHEYSFFMFRNLVIQGNPITTRYWSQRLVLFTWYLFCFIIYALYSGLLTATLIIPAYEKPIDYLQDLPRAVADGFTMSVVGGTTNEYIFKEATGGILKQVWELFDHKDRSKSFLPNPTTGLELILAEKYVHICPQDVARLLATKMGRTKFYFGKGYFFPQFDGFALPPGAPYKKPMDAFIRKMNEAGLTPKWRADEIQKLAEKFVYEETKSKTITLTHLQAAFFILFLGFLIAGIALALENILVSFFIKEK